MRLLFIIISIVSMAMGCFPHSMLVDRTEMTYEHISGQVYMFTKIRTIEYGGNPVEWMGNFCAGIGPDGILLVDNGIDRTADKISHLLQEITDEKIKYIVNTHWHPDHTGANSRIGPGLPIIAHPVTRMEMMKEKTDSDGFAIPAVSSESWPTVTFRDTLHIMINGEKVILFHFPHGHTMGDIVVYFSQSHVIYMGDAYNGGTFPRVCGDVTILANQYRELVNRMPKDVVVLSGHRLPADWQDLQRYSRMLNETVGFVRDKMVRGDTLRTIQFSGLSDEWIAWGNGNMINALSSEEWLENVWNSLKRYHYNCE